MVAEIPQVPLPFDDKAIEHALTELDAKVAAWSETIMAAEATIREAGARQSTISKTGLVDEQEGVAEPRVIDAVDAPIGDRVDLTRTTVSDTSPADADRAEGEEDMSAGAGMDVEQADVTEDDDESLLARLDEQTAKRIRIMRRVNKDKKTVRQLLEIHRMRTPVEASSKSEKRSWWRRSTK